MRTRARWTCSLVGLLLGGASVARAGSLATDGAWTRLEPAIGRVRHSAIVDPLRDRIVVFGGRSGSNVDLDDVWALPLSGTQEWRQLAPAANGPSARSGHVAIRDPLRDRMLVFGGVHGATPLNDVWALSSSLTPVWTNLMPSGTPPKPRSLHCMVYDPVRDRLLVFGGFDGSSQLSDVWALSLVGTPAWTQLFPTGPPIPPRRGASAVYDPVSDRLIVFGGYDGSNLLADTWALSLSGAPAWSPLSPAGTPPSARVYHVAIFDPAGDRMIVFGGNDTDGLHADTWALSLGASPAWTPLATPGGAPPARAQPSACFDPARGQMVVAFGSAGTGVLADTWALSLSGEASWTDIVPTWSEPSHLDRFQAFLESARHRMIFFDPTDSSCCIPGSSELWSLSADETPMWTRLATSGTRPPQVYGPILYDPPRDRMILLSGANVWALSLADPPTWTQLSPAGVGPSDGSLVYDPVRDRMIVCGSSSLWALDLSGGTSWSTIVAPGAQPDRRVGFSTIYDPVRDRLIQYGGYSLDYGGSTLINELWSLTLAGTPQWSRINPLGDTLAGSYRHSAVYDPIRDRMLVFGGDTWSVATYALSLAPEAETWSRLEPAGGPAGPRPTPGAIFDAARDRMFIYGGPPADAWRLDWTPTLDAPPIPEPGAARLAPASPNPSAADVAFGFELAQAGRVSLRVFDVSGRTVRVLQDGFLPAGRHAARWDRTTAGGERAPTGLYLCELRAGGVRLTRRLVLL